MGMITGYPSEKKEDRSVVEPSTVNRAGPYLYGLNTLPLLYAFEVGTDAAESGSTAQTIVATSHSAQTGDFIVITSGNLQYHIATVKEVATNSITLSQELAEAPGVADTFSIRRYMAPKVNADGEVQTNASGGGGGGTEYTEDAAAPANPEGGVKQLVRADTPAAVTSTDGDIITQRGSNFGASYSHILDASGNIVSSFGTDPVGLKNTSATPIDPATEGKQDSIITDLGTIAGNQLPDGHNVTIDNAAGASAVNIQDGGNSITVDGTVTANQGASPWEVQSNSANIATETTLSTLNGKLPTVALAADNTANPTITKIGTYPQWYDGATWDRASGDSTNGLLVNLGTNNDVAQATASNLNAQVVGNVAHDAADSGNPVKVGGRGHDYEPDASDEHSDKPSEVGKLDRANLATNLRGEQIEGVNSKYVALTDLDQTYDDSPTTDVSANIECWNYRYATVCLDIESNGTPTDIVIEVECSYDGTNFFKLMVGPLSSWIYEDTATASGLQRALTFAIACQLIRVRVTCTGTNGSGNEFVLTNSGIYLRN